MSEYKKGSWNVICMVCGFKFKAEDVVKRWDGVYVCKEDHEFRHPGEFIRGVPDQKPLPFTSPEPADTFVSVSYVASTVGNQSNDVPSGNNDGSL